ncbi:MAG: insulinase family protein, partial [Prevotella sp.]|nr:insulinase family protein [Prevotella sp.]
AKERTANAAAYRFTIVGDFDEAELRPLIEQYIASLPSSKKIVKGHKVVESTDDNVINRFTRKAEQPKANAVMVWLNKKMPYSMESSIQASIAGQILSMIYLNKIREEAGAAYSCGASGMMSKTDKDVTTMMQAFCPMKPEKAEEAIKIMREEVPALTEKCDADMLTKVKEYMLKSADDAVKTNGYWMNVINTYDRYGLDNHTEYKNTVAAQTPEKICNFMKKFLKGANLVQVIMLPEE